MNIKHYFFSISPLIKKYWFNVFVGTVIAAFFSVTGSSQLGDAWLNTAFDQLVRYEYDNTSSSVQDGKPLYFVEITPDEYRQWGEPLITPRNRLADLVEAAWKKGAPVVVLDILLDRPDRENPDGDAKLRRLLEKMLRENSHTKVVFPVRIGADGLLRSHIFEDLLQNKTADGQRIFYPAVPSVLASEGDLLNRFWGLYQVGRDQRGHTIIVWSVAVLASVLHAETQGKLEEVGKALISGTEHESSDSHATGVYVELGDKKLHLPPLKKNIQQGIGQPVYVESEFHSLPYTQRIRFLIPPDTKARRDAGNFRPGLSPDTLAGKIVVIGNSSPETGDILATPVGRIPGMYLIGNAINTIVTGRMPSHMKPWAHFTIELIIILIAAVAFYNYQHILVQYVLSFVFLVVFILLSWILFQRNGEFFNFILPAMGMMLHRIASDLESLKETGVRKKHDHH
jgi:hypothetical protein